MCVCVCVCGVHMTERGRGRGREEREIVERQITMVTKLTYTCTTTYYGVCTCTFTTSCLSMWPN